jgi:hypothetical protein
MLQTNGKLVILQQWDTQNSLADIYDEIGSHFSSTVFKLYEVPHRKISRYFGLGALAVMITRMVRILPIVQKIPIDKLLIISKK